VTVCNLATNSPKNTAWQALNPFQVARLLDDYSKVCSARNLPESEYGGGWQARFLKQALPRRVKIQPSLRAKPTGSHLRNMEQTMSPIAHQLRTMPGKEVP
jgi:hypothetical protein